jgi:hypothetical protein
MYDDDYGNIEHDREIEIELPVDETLTNTVI